MSNKSGKPKKKSSIRDYSAKDRLVARQRKQKIAIFSLPPSSPTANPPPSSEGGFGGCYL